MRSGNARNSEPTRNLNCIDRNDYKIADSPNVPLLRSIFIKVTRCLLFETLILNRNDNDYDYDYLTNCIVSLFTDPVLVQQVDYLETIMEETSDDLQSDSDRSGTTYWLGSDSETESVIHIRAKQRSGGKNAAPCYTYIP